MNDETVEAVKKTFSLYLKGVGFESIVKKWIKQGILLQYLLQERKTLDSISTVL